MQIKDAILNIFKKDLMGKTGNQTVVLFSSQIIAMVLGVLIGIINTRILGPDGYGILAFFLSLSSFTLLFFRFGLFSATGLLVAEEKAETHERELIGTSVYVAFFVGFLYSIFIFALSFFIDDMFNTNIADTLRIVSILLVFMPLSFMIPQVGRGANKIGTLSLFNIIPKAAYIVGAFLLLYFIQPDPFHFIVLNVVSTIFGIAVVVYLFRPIFKNRKQHLKTIWQKTKDYGFDLYLGQIAGISTYQLDAMFITIFVNTTELGFYSLAMTFTFPMVHFSKALSTSMFKKFVDLDIIPRKIIFYNFIWLIGCLFGLLIFGRLLIQFLYTDAFLPSLPLILPLAFAGLFQGMYQPYNMFLGAKAKGKWLRNGAFALAFFNVQFNIILIPLWGAHGAAVASALSMGVFLSIHIFYYNRYLKDRIKGIQNSSD